MKKMLILMFGLGAGFVAGRYGKAICKVVKEDCGCHCKCCEEGECDCGPECKCDDEKCVCSEEKYCCDEKKEK